MSSLAEPIVSIFVRLVSFILRILVGVVWVIGHGHRLRGFGLPATLGGPVPGVVVSIVREVTDGTVGPEALTNKPFSNEGWLKSHGWSQGALKGISRSLNFNFVIST